MVSAIFHKVGSPNYFHSWSYIDGLITPHLKVHLLHGILEFNKLSVSQNWWLWSEQNTQIVSTNSSSPWPLWSITSWPKFVIFKFGRRGLTFKTPQQGLSDCSLASSFMGHWVRPHKFLSMSGESFMLQEPYSRVQWEWNNTCQIGQTRSVQKFLPKSRET